MGNILNFFLDKPARIKECMQTDIPYEGVYSRMFQYTLQQPDNAHINLLEENDDVALGIVTSRLEIAGREFFQPYLRSSAVHGNQADTLRLEDFVDSLGFQFAQQRRNRLRRVLRDSGIDDSNEQQNVANRLMQFLLEQHARCYVASLPEGEGLELLTEVGDRAQKDTEPGETFYDYEPDETMDSEDQQLAQTRAWYEAARHAAPDYVSGNMWQIISPVLA